MKYFPILIVLLISLTSILGACSSKCNAFNEDILQWFPYQKSETIILSANELNDSLTLMKSVVYHTEKIGAWAKCDCEDRFMSTLKSSQLEIEINFSSSMDPSSSYLRINNEYLHFHKLVYNYDHEDNSYSQVIIYTSNLTDKNKQFEEVILAKSFGIISIKEKDKTWIPNSQSPQSINKNQVKYNKTNC